MTQAKLRCCLVVHMMVRVEIFCHLVCLGHIGQEIRRRTRLVVIFLHGWCGCCCRIVLLLTQVKPNQAAPTVYINYVHIPTKNSSTIKDINSLVCNHHPKSIPPLPCIPHLLLLTLSTFISVWWIWTRIPHFSNLYKDKERNSTLLIFFRAKPDSTYVLYSPAYITSIRHKTEFKSPILSVKWTILFFYGNSLNKHETFHLFFFRILALGKALQPSFALIYFHLFPLIFVVFFLVVFQSEVIKNFFLISELETPCCSSIFRWTV